MRSRLREALGAGARYGRPFSLVLVEALPGTDGHPVRARIRAVTGALVEDLRPSDVIATVFEDTVAVLLAETDADTARDAVFRMRALLARHGGAWRIATYSYPAEREAIERLSLLEAA
jgi:hypothetical protein